MYLKITKGKIIKLSVVFIVQGDSRRTKKQSLVIYTKKTGQKNKKNTKKAYTLNFKVYLFKLT